MESTEIEVAEINELIDVSNSTQKEIAEKVGINHIHLNSVLKGRNKMTKALYSRLKYHLTNNDV